MLQHCRKAEGRARHVGDGRLLRQRRPVVGRTANATRSVAAPPRTRRRARRASSASRASPASAPRAFDLPIVITRLNTLTGLPGVVPGDAHRRGHERTDDGRTVGPHATHTHPHRRHEVDARTAPRRRRAPLRASPTGAATTSRPCRTGCATPPHGPAATRSSSSSRYRAAPPAREPTPRDAARSPVRAARRSPTRSAPSSPTSRA